MKAVDFSGANTTLGAPEGSEHNVEAMRVFRNGRVCVSCWQLSEAEVAELARNGGKLFLAAYSGHTQPPVFIGLEDDVREVVADLGPVWRR